MQLWVWNAFQCTCDRDQVGPSSTISKQENALHNLQVGWLCMAFSGKICCLSSCCRSQKMLRTSVTVEISMSSVAWTKI